MSPYAPAKVFADPHYADPDDEVRAGQRGRPTARRRTRTILKKRARAALKRDTARRVSDCA